MMRLTNKRIIGELFPILRKAMKNVPELDERDYKGRPCKEVIIDGYQVFYTKWGDDLLTVRVLMRLPRGRYDYAGVSAEIHGNEVRYYYTKEFRGLGNGFYAELDEEGRIIRSEWD